MCTAYLLIKFYLMLFGFMAAIAIYCGGWLGLFGATVLYYVIKSWKGTKLSFYCKEMCEECCNDVYHRELQKGSCQSQEEPRRSII